jgi:hypothetical protein
LYLRVRGRAYAGQLSWREGGNSDRGQGIVLGVFGISN